MTVFFGNFSRVRGKQPLFLNLFVSDVASYQHKGMTCTRGVSLMERWLKGHGHGLRMLG